MSLILNQKQIEIAGKCDDMRYHPYFFYSFQRFFDSTINWVEFHGIISKNIRPIMKLIIQEIIFKNGFSVPPPLKFLKINFLKISD